MTSGEGGNGAAPAAAAAPFSLAELMTLRTDYEDVSVQGLGGATLRVYALTGTARATLVPDMAELAAAKKDDDASTIRAVWSFQVRVVAASLGYPQDQWDQLGDAMGSASIEQLYGVAARLSALDGDEQKAAKARLPRARNAASGTA